MLPFPSTEAPLLGSSSAGGADPSWVPGHTWGPPGAEEVTPDGVWGCNSSRPMGCRLGLQALPGTGHQLNMGSSVVHGAFGHTSSTAVRDTSVCKAGRCSNAAGASLGVVLSTSLIIFPLIIHLAEQQVE